MYIPAMKSKEAEDIPLFRPPLPRQNSLQDITLLNKRPFSLKEPWKNDFITRVKRKASRIFSRVANDPPALNHNVLTEKSGQLWECIDRKPDKHAGYLYIFKIRDVYNDIKHGVLPAKAKNKEIFPDSEPTLSQLQCLTLDYQCPKAKYAKCYELSRKISRTLGYRLEGNILTLPDSDALRARWETLRQRYPNLSPLSVYPITPSTTDLQYVESFFTHDVRLSSGALFVHDHFTSIVPTLFVLAQTLIQRSSYAQEKWELVRLVHSWYRRFQIARRDVVEKRSGFPQSILNDISNNIEKFDAALRTLVDAMPGIYLENRASYRQDKVDRHIYGIWHNEYAPYWNKRFGEDKVSGFGLNGLRHMIVSIEEFYTR